MECHPLPGQRPNEPDHQYPEELYQSANRIAAAENVSVEELFASAFGERILEFERLRANASRGSYEESLIIINAPTDEKGPALSLLSSLLPLSMLRALLDPRPVR